MGANVGVNSKGTTGGGTSVSCSAVTTQASGSNVVLWVVSADATAITIPNDSKGNAYTAVAGATGLFAGGNKKLWCFKSENITGGASHTATANASPADAITLLFEEATGCVTSSGLDTAVTNYANDTGSPFTVTGGTQGQANELVFTAISGNDGSNTASTEGTGFTKTAEEQNGGSFYDCALAHKVTSATTASTPSWTRTGATDCGVGIIAFKEAASYTFEQEGFRFGEDDANEASHTFTDAQDTSITAAAGSKLLRLLVDTTLDSPAIAYTLYAQKNGAGGYSPVKVGSATSPVLSFGAAGTLALSTSGGTSVAPTYPSGITVNSALVLVIGQKPTTANGGTATTPSGWTLQGSLTGANDGDTGGYTSTLGADTGNCNIYVYTKDTVSGSETGTLSVTVGDNGVCWANIYRVESNDTCTLSYACSVGKDTSAGNVSIATGSMNITAGDYLIGGMVIPTDVTTPAQFSAEALSQSGTTFGSVTEVQEPDSTVGNDIGGFIIQAGVSSGSGTGAVTMTATAGGTTTNVRGPGFVIRVRAAAVNNDVYVSTSANITAGGEATTARLTAPSGKSTSDFTTGRRWDDENGTDTIDVGSSQYTELEWALTMSGSLSNGDYFDFEVYAGASPLNTYTVTPRWTIGSGGDVTVALTGQAIASAAGTLSPATSKTLSGSALASAAGTLAPTLSLALSGSALASAQGTLVPALSKALSGQALASAQGTLAPAFTIPLTGLLITIGQGTVTAPGGGGDVTVALTGQAIGISQGSVGPAISKALTGSQLSASSGTLGVTRSAALVGAVLSVTPGALTPSTQKALTGSALSSAAGSLSPALSLSLSGSLLSFGQGSLTPVGGVSPTVVGVKNVTISWPDRAVTAIASNGVVRVTGRRTVH